jgi:DNA topoisomerase-1
MTDLIICEKPNVAKKIADALGRPKKKSSNGVPYYELERNGKKILVASAVGHLYTLEEKGKENRKFGEYPVFDIDWVPASVEENKKYVQKYINVLKKLSKEADDFYIASDWDIEGELIGYHALYYCCGKKNAKRMRFSSLTKKEIVKAYENPDEIDFGLVDAGDSRHKVDWYFGINISRALMQAIRAVKRWKTMSTGRVQGPALSFLVDKELEIRKFVPKPYWVIDALLEGQLTAVHENEKFWDEKEANKIYNKIKEEKEAIVSEIKKTKKKIKPNPPFDLGTLQREAHKTFRFSPKKTQEIAQKLYEKGLCLHPDTLISLPDGIKKIKDLDEEGEVLCLDNDLKLTKSRYKLLKRTVKEKLIKITLNDGTELTTTKEHPVLVYRDGLVFVPSEELKENEQVIMFMNTSEKRFDSKLRKPSVFESGGKTKFIDFILENLNGDGDYILIKPSLTKKIQKLIVSNKSRKQIMEIFGIKESTYHKYLRTGKIPIKIIKYLINKNIISKEDIESNYLGFCYGTSTIPVNIKFTNDFWYLYGYVIGDGHLTNNGKITIPAKDRGRGEKIINAIIQSCKNLNLNWRYDDKYNVIYISSKSLTRVFEGLGCPYGNKTELFDIPNIVFEDIDYIASLLAGYYDADGHFSTKKTGCNNNSPQINLTSKNINVLKKIKIILQFLGIGGYIWTKKSNAREIEGHDLKIYSKDADKFYNLIINHTRVKKDELQNVKELSIRNYKKYSHHYSIIYANWENKFKSGIIRKFNLSNQVSKNRGLSLNKLRELSEYLIDNDLKRISKGDVYISKIKEIKEIEYEDEVYDLTVETYHNFIANGVIVHNCSYPRTSSQKLPKDRNYLEETLKNILGHSDYGKYVDVILKEKRKPIEGKKDDPAHPAIHVVDTPKEDLPDDEKKLYDLIARRTLATFWDDAEREYVKVVLDIMGEKFKLSGSRTVKEGWHEIYPFTKFDENELPPLKKNDKIKVEKVSIERKETKPPKRYTMSSIIKELEDRKLGTKSTRADIVEKLVKRGYVVEDGSLSVTDLGIGVIETLRKYCPEIIDEKMTRELEEKLELIQDRKVKKEDVLEDAKKKLTKILNEFKEKESEIGKELVEKIDTTNKSLKTIGKCKCGGDLIIIRTKGKKRFVGCTKYPECDITYPLPQKGRIKVLNETCETCESPMISIDNRKLCVNPDCSSKITEEEVKELETAKNSEKTCPKCGGSLVIRRGIYGVFLGCENYPKCKYTEKLNNKNSEKTEKEVVGECPKCGSELLKRRGRYGQFIGCSNYPDCKYTETLKKQKSLENSKSEGSTDELKKKNSSKKKKKEDEEKSKEVNKKEKGKEKKTKTSKTSKKGTKKTKAKKADDKS